MRDKIIRRAVSLLAAAVLAVGGGALVASAPAAASYTDCGAGNVCLFDHGNTSPPYTGIQQKSAGAIYQMSGHKWVLSAPDWVSGVYNNSGSVVQYWDRSTCSGGGVGALLVYPGDSYQFEPYYDTAGHQGNPYAKYNNVFSCVLVLN